MIKSIVCCLCVCSFIFMCCSKKVKPAPTAPDKKTGYYTQGSHLMKDECEWEMRGTDKMSLWDKDYQGVADWGMDITRECIDMKCTSDAELVQIVRNARAKGFVTILTAFWWDSDAVTGGTTPYPGCQLLGAIPSQDTRFDGIQKRWREIARLFKNQSDVWFGLWNEPYDWKKENTASSEQWLADATLMVDNVRNTGAGNILVLCGNAMGQGHEPFLQKGTELAHGRTNIVFDIHAYRTYWDVSRKVIETRLNEINALNIAPVIIGEFAANGEHPYVEVMAACKTTRTSLLAWLWNQYEEPFLSSFKQYCLEERNLDCVDR
jgi:mannan endo-1,4-beta-mannosidase